jgi:hypothetical protein
LPELHPDRKVWRRKRVWFGLFRGTTSEKFDSFEKRNASPGVEDFSKENFGNCGSRSPNDSPDCHQSGSGQFLQVSGLG